jgi:chemotaxis protein MotA
MIFGGTIAVTLLTFPTSELKISIGEIAKLCTDAHPNLPGRVGRIINVSKRARREGRLILEREAQSEADKFFRHCLQMAVDETSTERFKLMVSAEIEVTFAQSERVTLILLTMAQFAPAVGFIGTLLGLLEMLGTLGDAAKVGPSMALALMATLYGSLFAQLILIPLAGRIQTRAEDERAVREATVVGLSAVIRDENPVDIEHQLVSYLPR